MNSIRSIVCMLVLVLGPAMSEVWAQHSEHGAAREVSIEQAMALFHSFWFDPDRAGQLSRVV